MTYGDGTQIATERQYYKMISSLATVLNSDICVGSIVKRRPERVV